MAMKLDAGEVGRSDLYSFFPENIVVDHAANSRTVPHTPEEIDALAKRIQEYGQQVNAVVRRIDGNRVQLVSGYGRHAAIALLNQQSPDRPLKLKCVVIEANSEDAFVRSIVENSDRKNTNAVDDAYAQRKLREDFGWSEKRIADFYESSVSHVGQLRKVLQLSAPIQAQVANGSLPVSTALDLAELPEAERLPVLAEATENGKVDGNVVRAKVREKKIETGGARSRTMKEVRDFFESNTGPAETEAIRSLSKKVLDFIGGKITDVQMSNALAKWTVAEKVEVA